MKPTIRILIANSCYCSFFSRRRNDRHYRLEHFFFFFFFVKKKNLKKRIVLFSTVIANATWIAFLRFLSVSHVVRIVLSVPFILSPVLGVREFIWPR